MKRLRWLALVLSAGLSAGLAYMAFGGGVSEPKRVWPPLPYRAAGVTISSVPSGGLAAGETIHGLSGDFLVQNGKIGLVIGGESPGLERRSRRGALLDLVAKSRFGDDELIDFRTFASAGGRPLSLQVLGTQLVTDSKFPFVRVEQATQEGRVRLMTDLLVAPGSSTVRLVTELTNHSGETLRDVAIGDRTRWPGAPAFVPRVGFPKPGMRAEVPWLARQGRHLSYAIAFPSGPVEASFFFDRISQIGQETFARFGDVRPGTRVTFTRDLSVVEGDLGRAAELAFKSLGRKVGRIAGKLDRAQSWARIEALYPDGKPALAVRAGPDGAYSLPLPAGDYLVRLRAPGGEDRAEVHVEAGATVTPRLIAPEPGLFKYRIADESGVTMPARIVVRGVPPTVDPELGDSEHNVIFTRSGEGEVELRPGRYKIVVTRGPEYDIREQEVDVSASAGETLHATLRRVVDTRGWLGCDFHLHQAPSHDSSVTLEDRVTSLLAEGVEFAVPTDHNHVTDLAPAIAALKAEADLGSTPGVEITTLSWGHFNAFPYPLSQPAPPHAGIGPLEIFATVRERAPDAIVQVNHPRMPGVGYFNRIELDAATGFPAAEHAALDFDAIEVVNGYDIEAPGFVQQNLREFFALLNVGHRYTATGNSDSHRTAINWAGYPRTYVRMADDQPERAKPHEVANALMRGQAMVANGIFLRVAVNGTAGPGDTVSGRRVTLDVEGRAPAWVDVSGAELWVNGALAETAPKRAFSLGARRLFWHTELDLAADAWVVVVARGERPMSSVFVGRRVLPFAFTNPVFVDADESGMFDAPEPKLPAPGPSAAPPP